MASSPMFVSATEEDHRVVTKLKDITKVYRRACSQVILLNNKIESAKTRQKREKTVKRCSFRNVKALQLNNLASVRNLIHAHASAKCEEIESLQAKLQELTGDARQFIMANYSKK